MSEQDLQVVALIGWRSVAKGCAISGTAIKRDVVFVEPGSSCCSRHSDKLVFDLDASVVEHLVPQWSGFKTSPD